MIASKDSTSSLSTRSRRHAARVLLLVGVLVGLFGLTPVAAGAFEPSKWVLSSTIGHDVDKTKTQAGAPQEERNQCTVASKDECQFGEEATAPRGFSYPRGVAVNASNGDVYVADAPNYRVQVLSATGEFLFMFGWNVNVTKVALGAGASQQEKNVCTAASHDQCGSGEAGTNNEPTGLAEQMDYANGVAVDSATGRVYVVEREYHRVEEFTETGEFVLMFGGGVNKKGGNVCTKTEVSECQSGKEGAANGEFTELTPRGNAITVGPEGLVYVGDRARVQKFEADGAPVGAPLSTAGLSSTGPVENVAVDSAGDVFLSAAAIQGGAGVHEYNSSGVLQSCVIDGAAQYIQGVALDAYGRIAVSDSAPHVALYQTQGKCGETVGGEITPPSGTVEGLPYGLAFSLNPGDEDQLYIANENAQRVESYVPVRFPEVRTCATGTIMFTTALLCGEVNANTLATRGFFKYGPGEERVLETPTAFTGAGGTFEPMTFEVTGLIPNESYSDEAWVEAENEGKETTAGAPPPVSFHTATPAPVVPGVPSASDVTNAFALLSASLNPEHAVARYHFEYGPCAVLAGCAGVAETADQEASLYGSIAAVQETGALQSDTTYSYRLVADNEHEEAGDVSQGGVTVGSEGHFTTAASPVPTAETGGASGVGATSAVISGTADPDGQPATYAFELGVYNGASTRYGIVFSGPAGASAGAVAESLPLAGLQPGTTYAYRIVVNSGYGKSVGATVTFTTEGLPAALAVPTPLPMLAVPNIAFPTEVEGVGSTKKATPKCAKGKRRSHDKCVRVRAKKKGKRVEKSVKHRK